MISLNMFERLTFTRDFLRLMDADPNDDDLPSLYSRVAAYFDRDELISMYPSLLAHPEVIRVMESNVDVEFPDFEALLRLPGETLGNIYATVALGEDFGPSKVEEIDQPEDPRFTSLRNHMTVNHYVWHIVTDIGTDMVGELEFQAFMFAQIGGPVHMFTSGLAFMAMVVNHQTLMESGMKAVVRGWLHGRRARSLIGVDWSQWWETPLDDVREHFCIDREAVDTIVEV